MHGNIVKIRRVKPEIRVLGVDDGVFVPHSKGVATVVGIVYRGGHWLDGVMRTEVEIDGMDATEKIASMVTASPHYDQLRVVMLNGVTFAGFNMVNIKKLFERVRLPVITVTREKPDFDDIKKALRNLPEYEKRVEAMENAGKLMEVHTRDAEQAVYVQIAGISERDAAKILKSTSTRSNIPEALRVAHIIASGLTRSKEKV
jgi:endonuclease V-like protein UPF0215 family